MLLQDTIGIYPKAFSNELCDTLMKMYDTALTTGNTFGGMTGIGVDKTIKNSVDFDLIKHSNTNPAVLSTSNEVYKIFNDCIKKYITSFPHQDQVPGMSNFIEPTTFASLQVQRYTKGTGHYNAWHHEGGTFKMSRRFFALRVYLNDVEEGGETEMLYTGQKIKPEKGLTIVWPVDWTFVHKGITSPTQDKYVVTGWYGWERVPDNVSEACITLMQQYFEKDRTWKDKYVKNISTFDWKFEFMDSAHKGTGSLYADQLLAPYVTNGMVII